MTIATDMRSTTVKLDASAYKDYGRNAQWTASLGVVQGRGSTLTEAREALTEIVQSYIRNSTTRSTVVLDDNGALVYFSSEGMGTAGIRVVDGRVTSTSFQEGSPDSCADLMVANHSGARRLI